MFKYVSLLRLLNMDQSSQKVARLTRDRTNDNFLKQTKTLFRKGDRLRKYEADIFIFLRRREKSYIYNSRNSNWVPTEKEMVSI
jgi:hypothetical protein